VLQTLADQVAVALSNARLFQQARESAEAERRAYGELTRSAWLSLLRAQADVGYVSDVSGTVPVGDLWEPQMEAALHTGEPAFGEEAAATLSIPVRVRGQVVGVVDGRKPDGTEWLPEEVDLLEAMAEQLNVALEGAQLYRDARRREARERTIGQVTGRIRQSLDLETMLRTAASEIRETMGLDKIVVRLATPARDEDRV
jgi:GAF domain-containing protein